MKKIILFVFTIILFYGKIESQNALNCTSAEPFCSGVVYAFPMNVNTPAENGPNYACLCTQPNPVWYFARIGQSGTIEINIQSPTGNDVDFICWGPYSNPVFPCDTQLTSSCLGCASGGCPNNTTNPNFYPSGNVVDCSYDPSFTENLHILNALTGEYYMICITNYSNQAGNITFSQTNFGQPGAGATDCSFMQNQYVNGTVYWDVNGNNIMDSTESGIQGAIVYINGCFGAVTENDGTYALYTCDTNDVIQISMPSDFLVNTVTPSQYQLQSSQSVYDFAVTLLPEPELSIDVTHYGSETVNENSSYLIGITNFGGVNTGGTYQLQLDSGLTFVSSTYPYSSVNGNLYEWTFTSIQPLETIENNIVVLSDSMLAMFTPVSSSAFVQSALTEANLTNNSDLSTYEILTSLDPNYIDASPNDTILQLFVDNSDFIEYTIHFQNTGSYAANKIRINNPMPDFLLKTSFELLGSSHPCDVVYNSDGSVVFLFNNINLPAESVNEVASCGFVKYRMRCNSNLQFGDHINNTADIFFDFNPAVTTNTTDNFLYDAHMNVEQNSSFEKMKIYPIPSKDIVNIVLPQGISGNNVIEICTPGGMKVKEVTCNSSKVVINVSDLNKGIYVIKLRNSEKVIFGKMIVN